MTECEHCQDHGKGFTDLEWTKEKVKLLCAHQDAFEEKVELALDKRLKNSVFYWIFGGFAGIILMISLVIFNEVRDIPRVVFPKLSVIEKEQVKTTQRIDGMCEKIADLASNQRMILQRIPRNNHHDGSGSYGIQ